MGLATWAVFRDSRPEAVSTPTRTPRPTPTATPAPPEDDGTVEWQTFQRPSIDGVVQQSSIEEVDAPGPAEGRPSSKVLRFSLDPEARFTSSGYSAPRAEVYGRHAEPADTDPTKWPDPVGSTRWYTFSIYIPDDFVTTYSSKWIVLTQWKGLDGGSPPISIEVQGDDFRLGGERANDGLLPNDGDLGSLHPGSWTSFSVGMKLSTSADDGWVEVLKNGETALPRTSVATMDTIDGHVDPIYLKQGIYQSRAWQSPHVVYESPVEISDERPEP